MLLGPVIRRTYLEKFVPVTSVPAPCLLVGVVEKAEGDLIASKGYQVVKADLNPRQSDVVAMDLTQPGDDHIGRYAVVVAFDVLEHIPDDRAAVAGIARLLEPGGQAFIHVPGGDINAPLDENDRKHGHVRHGYTEKQIKEVVFSQPFADIRYLKTFNPIELEAYYLALEGKVQEGIERLKDSPFDGAAGKCHMFIAVK